ncbi:MAG: hypothetical protein LUG23_05815 [Oscillospiraceae bacterium]|nr:hypothetical protein [Oscillospiraceae bacterium]
MDIFDLLRNVVVYIVYPICIVVIGSEVYRYIYMHYILIDKEDEDDDYDDYHELHADYTKEN